MTITIQEVGATPSLTQELSLAKLGADRRWALSSPALGQVVYLDKSGLRYLVLFERKQYIELNPDAFGFEPARVLTPNSIAERLRSQLYEKLGLEPVNGRTAIKYRVTESAGASTQTDGMVYVDQETRLPLRSELNTVTSSGTKVRAIVDVRDVQLNPDRAQFDVPPGTKKITQQEASQQVDAFARSIRSFADIVSGTSSGPVGGVSQPAANKNAGRGDR
jgi:outer membrane lipoprotein-sorting protein